MVLPLLKLGTLALKTLSKPIASRLKKQAAFHPKFRNSIIGIAQANHRLTTTIQRRIYGHATDVEIRPLNEEKAVQAASDLIGELFVFTIDLMIAVNQRGGYSAITAVIYGPLSTKAVAGVALIFEVQRSASKEAKKEEQRKQEMEVMRQRDEELAKEVELLKQKLKEIEQYAKGKGLTGVFTFRTAADNDKSVKAAS